MEWNQHLQRPRGGPGVCQGVHTGSRGRPGVGQGGSHRSQGQTLGLVRGVHTGPRGRPGVLSVRVHTGSRG